MNPRQAMVPIEANYDAIGAYDQDRVNGFPQDLLNTFVRVARLGEAVDVLDGMAGNGNLTERLYAYCQHHGIAPPNLVVLEYSRRQAELARSRLASTPARVIWGDILTMSDRATQDILPKEAFDRILIKSGNHEIPLSRQTQLYRSIHSRLRPGGSFVNLGFLFDEPCERYEFQELTRMKDELVGMHDAVANRYVLTREEFYSRLREVGFTDIQCASHVHYTIHARVVVEQYVPEAQREQVHAEIQARQAQAMSLRRSGRIRFEGDSSLMLIPGEITIAHRAAS